MGAVLGIAAFGRTQEKIAGSATNTPTPTLPTSVPAASGFPAPAAFPATPAPVAAAFPTPTLNSFPGDPPTRNTRNDG